MRRWKSWGANAGLEVLLGREAWKGVFLLQMASLSSLPSLFNVKIMFPLLLRLLGSITCLPVYSQSISFLPLWEPSLVSPIIHIHVDAFAFGLPVQSHKMCTEKTNCRDKLVFGVHDWSRAKYLNFRCLQRDFSLTSAFKRKIIKHYHYFRSELYCCWSKAVVRFTK